jgi:hypothetical protein
MWSALVGCRDSCAVQDAEYVQQSMSTSSCVVLQDARGVGGQEQDRLLAEGVEAADFLKTSVVQAKLNERGNYGAPLSSLPICMPRFGKRWDGPGICWFGL